MPLVVTVVKTPTFATAVTSDTSRLGNPQLISRIPVGYNTSSRNFFALLLLAGPAGR